LIYEVIENIHPRSFLVVYMDGYKFNDDLAPDEKHPFFST